MGESARFVLIYEPDWMALCDYPVLNAVLTAADYVRIRCDVEDPLRRLRHATNWK